MHDKQVRGLFVNDVRGFLRPQRKCKVPHMTEPYCVRIFGPFLQKPDVIYDQQRSSNVMEFIETRRRSNMCGDIALKDVEAKQKKLKTTGKERNFSKQLFFILKSKKLEVE